MPRPDNIRLLLDLSTSHLPENIAARDDDPERLNSYDGVTAYPMRHGWLLWVPDDPTDHASNYGDPADGDGVPAEVLAIQVHARSLGCDWVTLDSDAEVDPALPTWRW